MPVLSGEFITLTEIYASVSIYTYFDYKCVLRPANYKLFWFLFDP